MAEMSKSPEEIKKGLECCGKEADTCDGCPYKIEFSAECLDDIHEDALAYIQQLEEQNAKLVRKTDKLQSSMGQVEKALQDYGFQTFEELLQAHSQVKREQYAAMLIIASLMKIATGNGVECPNRWRNAMMKEDEICFFIACWFFQNNGISVRKVISMMGEIIPYKRCLYLLEKWDRLGFYDYGVTLDLGWFYPDKLPKRYSDLIQPEPPEEE